MTTPSEPVAQASGDADGPWFTTFFDDAYLRVFEPELGPGRTGEEVDGVLDLADAPSDARVLDLACGQGRHAVEFARRGHEVTGVDLSTTLLSHARQRAAEAGVEVTWLHQDMRVPVDGDYDLAVNLFNAFGYLESEHEDQRVLDTVAAALRPGGVFIQEISNREAQIRDPRSAEVHRIDERLTLIEEREIDLRSSRLRVDYTYVEGDRVTGRRHHVLRLYTLTELVAMHEAAGLHVEVVRGGWDGSALALDDFYVVLRSRRTG